MLDPIPMSLAHVSYGGEGAEDEPNVDFGSYKNDLTPFFGSEIKDKVVNTGKGVLSPIAGQALAPANKVRHRGKKTFEKLKSGPTGQQQESPYDRQVREAAYDRQVREQSQMVSQGAPLNLAAPSTPPQRPVDVSETIVSASPTSPGQPQYPLSDSGPNHWTEKSANVPRPSTDTAAAGYNSSQIGQTGSPPGESEDSIPLTRLSSQSEAQETQLDPEAAAGTEDNEAYFALPGGPGVIDVEETDGNDPDAFFPPATKQPQMILWLPRDELGLSEYEIEANAAAGVDSSSRRAVLNHEGKVRISGQPPKQHIKTHVFPV